MDRELQAADRVLKALADPTRLRIVGLLRSGEICVCHIYGSLNISQPKASRHLAYLRRAGVVRADKRGLWVYYSLATALPPAVGALLDAAVHYTTHLPTTARDVARLARTTGCPVAVPNADLTACCAPVARGSD